MGSALNPAQKQLIRLLAIQAARDYLQSKPAPLSQNNQPCSNRPIPSIADQK